MDYLCDGNVAMWRRYSFWINENRKTRAHYDQIKINAVFSVTITTWVWPIYVYSRKKNKKQKKKKKKNEKNNNKKKAYEYIQCMVNVLKKSNTLFQTHYFCGLNFAKFRTLYSILLWPKFCFLCNRFLTAQYSSKNRHLLFKKGLIIWYMVLMQS